MRIASNVTRLIGGTPLVALSRLDRDLPGRVVGKAEFLNPSSSVKDRIALSMIEAAEAAGRLGPDRMVIEPTSGNTGIGLALVCASRGYRLILTMPESMSEERRRILKALGAQLVLTPAGQGMKGAVERAQTMAAADEHLVLLQQFENPANPEVHRRTTGVEIWDDTDGSVDVFVAGVGTGGTLTGVGQVLKERRPGIEIVAVEPAESAVLSGSPPGPHGIQGIGAGFVPAVLDRKVIDRVETITAHEAMAMGRRLAREEGLLVGISAGANVAVALRLAALPSYAGKLIVTVLCDTGERYLTTDLFREE